MKKINEFKIILYLCKVLYNENILIYIINYDLQYIFYINNEAHQRNSLINYSFCHKTIK